MGFFLLVRSLNLIFQSIHRVILNSQRIRTLDGLLLVNKLDDDLKKYQISDVLKVEEERLSNLDKEFRIDINWEQKKSWFGFIN